MPRKIFLFLQSQVARYVPRKTIDKLQDQLIKSQIELNAVSYLTLSIIVTFIFFILFAATSIFTYYFDRRYFFLVSAVFFLLAALVLYYSSSYPEIRQKWIARQVSLRITDFLAITYSLSLSGIPVDRILRDISNMDSLGEIAKESKRIVVMMDRLGYDFLTALEKAEKITASDDLSRIWAGLRLSILLDTDIVAYFRDRIDYYSRVQENKSKLSLDSLGLASESFVALVIAFPLLIFMTGSIISIKNLSTIFFVISLIIVLGASAVMFYFTSKITGDLS
ncbi:TVG1068265 [Thermoplasma volcanium GSS1]|uniref:TVG1068265 protein n=1 Tax=Thermoplasma volcanium (strain ATCC 51530 / DSM 4299 / JCM 9571 / NBRC 15438 / GSS1) TaxID=273116 RepID=Q979W8_THEVO|nr:type II secretion system F family protein [Thermoplasma volcanium]BAB60184.1 TVG1068265 [Thermoplasma volcanium GSS1]